MRDDKKEKRMHIDRQTQKQKRISNAGFLKKSNETNSYNNSTRSSDINFKELFENTLDGLIIYDLEGNFINANGTALQLFGKNSEELKHLKRSSLKEHKNLNNPSKVIALDEKSESDRTPAEYELLHKGDGKLYIEIKDMLIKRNNKPFVVLSVCRDVTAQKTTEVFLKRQEQELKVKALRLEETNTALAVLMEQRQKDLGDLQEKIVANLKELVHPYIKRFRQTSLSDRQKAYLELIESGLKEIISPFSHTLKNRYLNLTSTEIRIADMIRGGKHSNEIGEIMKISERTVEFHRNNIRAKLGVRNKKMNLRTYLLSLQ